MRCALFALAVAGLGAFATAAQAQTSLPTGKGLPVLVKVAVAFVEIATFNENAATFKATVDVRLRWEDPRLRQPAYEATDPPKVYRAAEAQAQLAAIWVPGVEVVNQRGAVTYTAAGLRVYPDGRVELTTRTNGEFVTPFEVERFPFDRQKLQLELAIRGLTADAVTLQFEQDDLEYSRPAANARLDGWNLGLVSLRSEPLTGWYGASHARVLASLEVARQSGPIAAAIFIPLFASLLIPLLGIWLNRVEDGQFQIETFEFVNLIVGGLFAVIALNFTVNSLYQFLASGENPVHWLFALNYITLGVSLLINVLIFRFGVVERLLGRYVQEQLYLFLIWAIPVLVLTTASAVILVAMV
jgi:neurotransmitter-gated ion-channel